MDYRLITKKSAGQLRREGINVEYFREAPGTDLLKVIGEAISYREAFDQLMKNLEDHQRKYVKYVMGVCNIAIGRHIEHRLEVRLVGEVVVVI